jgi:hypothetical protein
LQDKDPAQAGWGKPAEHYSHGDDPQRWEDGHATDGDLPRHELSDGMGEW